MKKQVREDEGPSGQSGGSEMCSGSRYVFVNKEKKIRKITYEM